MWNFLIILMIVTISDIHAMMPEESMYASIDLEKKSVNPQFFLDMRELKSEENEKLNTPYKDSKCETKNDGRWAKKSPKRYFSKPEKKDIEVPLLDLERSNLGAKNGELYVPVSPNISPKVSPKISPKHQFIKSEKKHVDFSLEETEAIAIKSSKKSGYGFFTKQDSPPNQSSFGDYSEGFSSKTSKINSNHIRHRSKSKDNYQEIMEQKLFKAIEDNDTVKVKSILEFDVNKTDLYGRTSLITSVRNNNIDIVEMLLAQNHIDVNKMDSWGNTPLHHAALGGYENIVNLFLHDYRINFFLRNKANNFAHQLFTSHEKLKLYCFARTTLDNLVDQETFSLKYILNNRSADGLHLAIIFIRQRFAKDHEDQADYAILPQETQLPLYATDKFIKKMILYRLKCQKNDSHLEKQFNTFILERMILKYAIEQEISALTKLDGDIAINDLVSSLVNKNKLPSSITPESVKEMILYHLRCRQDQENESQKIEIKVNEFSIL